MEKEKAQTAPTQGPGTTIYDFMIEKLKAAAFPVLVGVVIWLGKDIISQVTKVSDQNQTILIRMERQSAVQEAQDRRLENVEEAIKTLTPTGK